MAKERSDKDQLDQIEEPSVRDRDQGEAEEREVAEEAHSAAGEAASAEAGTEAPAAEEEHQSGEAREENAETPDALREEIARLQEQLAQQKDMVLRAHAEVQNTRRRAQQDVEKARKFAVEKLLQDLLPVVDNLERALASIDPKEESTKAIAEGIELTHKSFIDTLAKHSVEVVDPAGEPFNPDLHEAMTQVPNGDVEPNTVLEVFQKGYLLNGRLVRPAMVVVSKAP